MVTHRDADAQTPGDLPEVDGDLLRPHAVHVRRQKEAVLQATGTVQYVLVIRKLFGALSCRLTRRKDSYLCSEDVPGDMKPVAHLRRHHH